MLKGDLDLRRVGRYCDALVGIFMMVLGVYGVFGSLKHARDKRRSKLKEDDGGGEMLLTRLINGICDVDSQNSKSSSNNLGVGKRNIAKASKDEESLVSWDTEQAQAQAQPQSQESDITDGHLHHHHHNHSHHHDLADDCTWCPFIDMRDPLVQRIVSFAIGLLHGVAGPGGVLAVFPTVQMTKWQHASVYLGSFIVASTFSMGVFASLFGEITKRIGASAESVELALRIASSAMSVIVGAVWLTLSILGKLDDLFH